MFIRNIYLIPININAYGDRNWLVLKKYFIINKIVKILNGMF